MQTIDLMQNNFKIPPLVYMVQNDTGRTLKMNIGDNTLGENDTAEVAINRSDGSYYTISATRVSGENAFTADMTQALTQPGLTKCQLKVTASTLVISTYTFVISVEQSTDGVSEEQLGVSPQELVEAAAQLTLSDNDVKLALLQIAEKTAYIDTNGQDYYDALYDALYPPIRAVSVSLSENSFSLSGLNQTHTLTATVEPSNVEDDTVYWGSSNPEVAVVADGVVTSVGIGDAVITATCAGKKDNAVLTVETAALVSISAAYTQSGTVYDTDSLDSLKPDLVVTATYADSSTGVITTYTLSGALNEGTSTITVTYQGESDTFDVVVTSAYTYYTVSNALTYCTNSNDATRIREDQTYVATLTPNTGYEFTSESITITMGGVDVTSTAFDLSDGSITIVPTGNISIIAVAEVKILPTWTTGVKYVISGDNVVEGVTLNATTGAEETSSTDNSTDFLNCVDAYAVTIYPATQSVYFYDKNKQFISRSYLNQTYSAHYVPSTAAYCRVCGNASSIIKTDGTGTLTLIPMEVPTEQAVIGAQTLSFEAGTITSDGSYGTASGKSRSANYISLYGATSLTSNCGQVQIAFYDGQKNFVRKSIVNINSITDSRFFCYAYMRIAEAWSSSTGSYTMTLG